MELAKDLAQRSHPASSRSDADRALDQASTFLLSGNGDLIEPDDGIVAIGSGADRLRWRPPRRVAANTELDARSIAEKAMTIASEICIYTNGSLVIEEL